MGSRTGTPPFNSLPILILKHRLMTVALLVGFSGCDGAEMGKVRLIMKHLLVTVALLVGFSGCDGAAGTGTEDIPDGGGLPKKGPALGSDGGTTVTSLQDAMPGYTASGVTVSFGMNPCGTGGSYGWIPAPNSGWDPTIGHCFTTSTTTFLVTSGVCEVVPQDKAVAVFNAAHGEWINPTCGLTYAPGTLLIWDATDPRFHYVANPSGGNLCLPNTAPYVVSC
jgi:hypothetical protein